MDTTNSRFHVGQSAVLTRTFGHAEVSTFAELCGDTNPVHLDEEYAKDTPFGARIAHGWLVSSMFSTLFGTVLPGEGALYLGQTLKFKAPVYLGDTVTARVELCHLRSDKPIATFRCECLNQSGELVIEGEAVIKLPC
jgi:acyl dehydratase